MSRLDRVARWSCKASSPSADGPPRGCGLTGRGDAGLPFEQLADVSNVAVVMQYSATCIAVLVLLAMSGIMQGCQTFQFRPVCKAQPLQSEPQVLLPVELGMESSPTEL